MKIIGVTGSIGTGKSTVSNFFKELGAYVIDLDGIVHELLRSDASTYKELTANFGKGILDKAGKIDRKRLSKRVFVNTKELKNLCLIIHPAVIRILKGRLDEMRNKDPDRVVVVDAPLLIEANLLDLVDMVLVVKTNLQNQFKRCIKKLKISRKDVERRMLAQMPLSQKERYGDFVIDNNFTQSNTKEQVKKIFELISRKP